ncbi:hypothetical protein PIROE2DRAFT_10578 [Piromyces sp. E2]|nr:hypothetical protein PIROE2DRAFT_10578 [Piromyces sp. E2]|eukprot:OUM63000.1 hypothetical protein PIROE2DRAFT_10578 [Piromyces sp. E2]
MKYKDHDTVTNINDNSDIKINNIRSIENENENENENEDDINYSSDLNKENIIM